MKIAEFFEKHVQWIALGLAGVWLVWVGWSYGVNRPTIQIGNETLSPGSVDENIRDTLVNSLTTKMGNQTVPPGLVDVPDFTDAFVTTMNGKTPPEAQAMVFNSAPQFQYIGTGTDIQKLPGIKQMKVAELPEILPPTDLTPNSGRSLAMVLPAAPKLPQGANNNNNNAAAEGRPNIFNNPVAQGQGANGAVQPVGVQTDKTWVTVFGKFNATAQEKEFKRVNIPQPLLQQIYTEVQLQREEVKPDGSFGPRELVKVLPMNEPPVDRKNATEFIAWASNAEKQQVIVQPRFYDVVKGAAWIVPQKDGAGAVAENVAPQPEQFNLQDTYQTYKSLKPLERLKWLSELTKKLTPDQLKEFTKYRQEEDAKEAKQKAPQRQPGNRTPTYNPRGAPRPPARGGEGGMDAIDPSLLREMFADDDSQLRPRRPYRGEDMDSPRGYTGPGGPRYRPRRNTEGDFVQPQQGVMVGNAVPDVNGNIDVWAHDETAQPGRTYHYRLRMVLKNPLYNTTVGTDPKMNQEPYLPLDPEKGWSDWSKAVAIPTNVDMMLLAASNLGGKETAKFIVKRFQEGQVNTSPQPFVVSPGDVIGGPEKVVVQPAAANAVNPALINPVGAAAAKPMVVDFTTNWTLVDIRQVGSSGDYRVRIMDAQGRMEMRTVSGDSKRFRDETATPAAKTSVGQVGLRTP